MTILKFTDLEKEIGQRMALDVNGGDWNKDYSDGQKTGWYLKARWMLNRFEAYL